MARIPNTFTQQNTPYFNRFGEYRTPNNTVEVTSLNEMISYSILTNPNGTTINKRFGVTDSYIVELNVKNITYNATLLVRIDGGNYFTIDQGQLTLEPNAIGSFTIRTNNEYINTLGVAEYDSTFNLVVVNQNNNFVVAKEINASELSTTVLSDEINIT